MLRADLTSSVNKKNKASECAPARYFRLWKRPRQLPQRGPGAEPMASGKKLLISASENAPASCPSGAQARSPKRRVLRCNRKAWQLPALVCLRL